MIIDLKKLKLEKVVIRHSLDIYEFIRHVIRIEGQLFNMVKEYFFVLSLNRISYVISLEVVALGNNSQVTVNPGEVFSLPLHKRAAGIYLLHNHPSGNLQPSEEDKDVTNRLIKAGEILKCPVIDHVIITDYSYYGFKDSGLLKILQDSLKYVDPYDLEKRLHDEMQEEIEMLKKEHRIKTQESLQKGIQKGIEEGIITGTQRIAKEMRSAGYKADEIAKLTGLSISEINSL
jgi:DNA repair protein RadC